jgi:hypothetical protein
MRSQPISLFLDIGQQHIYKKERGETCGFKPCNSPISFMSRASNLTILSRSNPLLCFLLDWENERRATGMWEKKKKSRAFGSIYEGINKSGSKEKKEVFEVGKERVFKEGIRKEF